MESKYLKVDGASAGISDMVAAYKKEYAQQTAKYEKLRELDFFILDNSLHESIVGQLRKHTIESKWAIYNESKKMGFHDIVVASFAHTSRVDDVFIQQLADKGEDQSKMWAFSEITEGTKNGVPDTETIPVGLRKMQNVGMYNVIFEIDHGDAIYDFKKFPMNEYNALLKKRIKWCYDNLHRNAKILINLRDIIDCLAQCPERVFETVKFLCTLSEELRLFGLVFEDSGESSPEEIGAVTKMLRKVMDDNNFNGHLLNHIHERFGLKDASTLESLMNGSDGIWASTIIEGGRMGAASSTITLMNLIRLGNKKVQLKYNCMYLRQCAINVTKIITGTDPFIKQPVYGESALDIVFGLDPGEFDLANFFNEEPFIRITALASPEMIVGKLVKYFGKDPQFTDDQAVKMKELMLADLKASRKEEYMSPAGLALLFDRAGGSLTEAMRDVITKMETNSLHADTLIGKVREIWDTWDSQEKCADRGDQLLNYDSFYNGFMAPYFGFYRLSDNKRALKAIDMEADNAVDWNEFMVYLKWALHQYPEIKDTDELLDITFRKGIIPAMQDEFVKTNGKKTKCGGK